MKATSFSCIGVALLAVSISVGCNKDSTELPTETDPGQETPEATNVEGIRITSVEPELAEVGATVTILGQDFGNQQDHNVSIGGSGINVELDVVEWRDDKIVAKIPDDPKIQQNQSYYYRVQSNDYKESSNLFNVSFK